MVDGRRKGNDYENEVARVLSAWAALDSDMTNYQTCPVDRLLFRRKPADNNNIVSDWKGGRDLIHAPTICFPFSIECKNWMVSFELSTLFRSRDIWKWWQQTQDQAVAENQWPMLVFSKNLNPDYVIIPQGAAQCLELQPFAGPCMTVQRPGASEPVVLALLSDLTRAPWSLVRKLDLLPRPAPPQPLATRSGCLRGKLKPTSRGC